MDLARSLRGIEFEEKGFTNQFAARGGQAPFFTSDTASDSPP
jgi:hypothetical protein